MSATNDLLSRLARAYIENDRSAVGEVSDLLDQHDEDTANTVEHVDAADVPTQDPKAIDLSKLNDGKVKH